MGFEKRKSNIYECVHIDVDPNPDVDLTDLKVVE